MNGPIIGKKKKHVHTSWNTSNIKGTSRKCIENGGKITPYSTLHRVIRFGNDWSVTSPLNTRFYGVVIRHGNNLALLWWNLFSKLSIEFHGAPIGGKRHTLKCKPRQRIAYVCDTQKCLFPPRQTNISIPAATYAIQVVSSALRGIVHSHGGLLTCWYQGTRRPNRGNMNPNCSLSGLYMLFLVKGRLCGLVVRVLGYRSGGSGSIPGTSRKKKE
jgi:hypothetical protein